MMWEEDGIMAEVRDSSGKSVWSAVVGEGDPPLTVDFSRAGQGRLRVVYSAADPRRPGTPCVPFIENLLLQDSSGLVLVQQRVLLQPQPYTAPQAKPLVKAVRTAMGAKDKADYDGGTRALQSLRNMALDRPKEVLSLLKMLRGVGGVHGAELISRRV